MENSSVGCGHTLTMLLQLHTRLTARLCVLSCRETELWSSRPPPIECAEVSKYPKYLLPTLSVRFTPTDASARPVRIVTADIVTAVSGTTRPTRGECNAERRRTRFLKRFSNRVFLDYIFYDRGRTKRNSFIGSVVDYVVRLITNRVVSKTVKKLFATQRTCACGLLSSNCLT